MNKLNKLKRYLIRRNLTTEARQLSGIIKNSSFQEVVDSVLPSVDSRVNTLVKNLVVHYFSRFNKELNDKKLFDDKNNFCGKMQNILYDMLAKQSRAKKRSQSDLKIDSEVETEWGKFISELKSVGFKEKGMWIGSGIAPSDKSQYKVYKKYITFNFLNLENTSLKDNISIFKKIFQYLFAKLVMADNGIKYKSVKTKSDLTAILNHADSIVIHFYSKEDFDRGSNIINNILSEIKSKVQYSESLILTDEQREGEYMRVSNGHDIYSSDTKDFSMSAANYLFDNDQYKNNINDILNREISEQELFVSFVIITLHYTYKFFDQWKNMSYEDKKETVLSSL